MFLFQALPMPVPDQYLTQSTCKLQVWQFFQAKISYLNGLRLVITNFTFGSGQDQCKTFVLAWLAGAPAPQTL